MLGTTTQPTDIGSTTNAILETGQAIQLPPLHQYRETVLEPTEIDLTIYMSGPFGKDERAERERMRKDRYRESRIIDGDYDANDFNRDYKRHKKKQDKKRKKSGR